jgi:hypothetical protein
MGGKGSGKKPREYPQEIIDLVTTWYAEGLTVAEIKAIAPKGYRIQTILERYVEKRRSKAKRNQRGAANHMWKGDQAGYQALHLRVDSERGKPMRCDWCESQGDNRYEWANLTGDYTNVWDYVRLCLSCHRTYDAKRRKETGRKTSMERRSANV